MCFVGDENVKGVDRYSREKTTSRYILRRRDVVEEKKKIICSGGKFKHILNSSEKVFYGGDTKFSYTTCQCIEVQAIETGKYIIIKCVDMVENAWCQFGS